MRKIYSTILCVSLFMSGAWADMDCPADSAVHVDTRTMLPDGSPNPTYGQEISTGLCGCLGFVDGASVDGNEVTFTIRIVDNEPIRGIELDIYHDRSVLEYGGVDKGDKLGLTRLAYNFLGGILNSAKLLSKTDKNTLYKQSAERIEAIIKQGTGAVEIKSGYGLNIKDEIKMLQTIRK